MRVLPRAWGESMRRDSEAWKLVCPCGHARSYWEIGGIRWKAQGNPRTLLRCPACGERTWHESIYKPLP